jgi:hypothetical protein
MVINVNRETVLSRICDLLRTEKELCRSYTASHEAESAPEQTSRINAYLVSNEHDLMFFSGIPSSPIYRDMYHGNLPSDEAIRHNVAWRRELCCTGSNPWNTEERLELLEVPELKNEARELIAALDQNRRQIEELLIYFEQPA